MDKVLIIAEVGENHIGDFELAKTAITKAHQAGADIVKFQSYRAQDLRDDISPDVKEWIQRVELSDEQHFELKKIADDTGIEFLSTPVNINRAELLKSLGLTKVKIASVDVTNISLLKNISNWAETIFLSTGMSTYEEIETALKIVDKGQKIFLLHCVSEYPAADKDANLRMLHTLKDRFKLPIGYSDHTIGILAPLAAVAMGAVLVEKHFTLDKALEGTDHILSATPDDLREMVTQIRRIETFLGDGEKRLTEGELENQAAARHAFIDPS